jgi:hypothetical protein
MTKSDIPERDWNAKGDAREVLLEELAFHPNGCHPDDGSLVYDQHMQRVLQRLADDGRACAAINAIAKTSSDIITLAEHCIDAELVKRTFRTVLSEEREPWSSGCISFSIASKT